MGSIITCRMWQQELRNRPRGLPSALVKYADEGELSDSRCQTPDAGSSNFYGGISTGRSRMGSDGRQTPDAGSSNFYGGISKGRYRMGSDGRQIPDIGKSNFSGTSKGRPPVGSDGRQTPDLGRSNITPRSRSLVGSSKAAGVSPN